MFSSRETTPEEESREKFILRSLSLRLHRNIIADFSERKKNKNQSHFFLGKGGKGEEREREMTEMTKPKWPNEAFATWCVGCYPIFPQTQSDAWQPRRLHLPTTPRLPFHMRMTAAHVSAWLEIESLCGSKDEKAWVLIYEAEEVEWRLPKEKKDAIGALTKNLPLSADVLLLGCLSDNNSTAASLHSAFHWVTPFLAPDSSTIQHDDLSAAKLAKSVCGTTAYLLRVRAAAKLLHMLRNRVWTSHGVRLHADTKDGGLHATLCAPPNALYGVPLTADPSGGEPELDAWVVLRSPPADDKAATLEPKGGVDRWVDFAASGYRGFRYVQGVAHPCLPLSEADRRRRLMEPRLPSARAWQDDARQLRAAGFWSQLWQMLRVLSEDPELCEDDRDWKVWDECLRVSLECGSSYRPFGIAAGLEWIRRNAFTLAGRNRLRRELATDPLRLPTLIKSIGDPGLSHQFSVFRESLDSIPL